MLSAWVVSFVVEVVAVLYLLAPLLVAAAFSGVIIRYDVASWLYRPIDGGARFRGKRVFGDSKSWRGVVTAVVGSILGVALQKYVPARWTSGFTLLDYRQVDPLLLGGALGLGATGGELPNSFVKRQLGIAPGATTRGKLRVVFYLWDQLDLLTGVWPLLTFWLHPTSSMIAISVALALGIHPIVALIGFLMHARRSAR